METNNQTFTNNSQATQQSYNKPLIVYASECHKIMTQPQKLKDELSQTTKTWLKEEAVAEVLGMRKIVLTKPIIKGMMCEGNSIDLYNQVMHTNYKKNEVTKEENGFRGTPDLITDEGIVEIKTSWDASTFPFFQEDVSKRIKKGGYHWQCRVYMMLFNIDKAVVSYCLVDTPHDPLFFDEGDSRALHRFDGVVAANKRISLSQVIERDKAIEQKMLERYELANRYYQNYLNELHNK